MAPDCTPWVSVWRSVRQEAAARRELLDCAALPLAQEGQMLKEFRDFVARGNVLDLAVGVIMGAAFGRIVTTLVEGVIMPPLGLLLGRTDFSSLFFVLDSAQGIPMSLAEAKTKGIPVIAYGQFINEIVSFLIVALAVFLLVRQVNRLKLAMDGPPPAVVAMAKDCPFCATSIPLRASRCPHCTSPL
jgi:large conductance mechanosensitive channel